MFGSTGPRIYSVRGSEITADHTSKSTDGYYDEMTLLRRLTATAPALIISMVCFAELSSELEGGLEAFKSKDYAKALYLLQPLAHEGSPEALYALGTMYQVGAGVELDDAYAENYYRQAAENGHGGASFQLGIIYLDVDNEEAETWLKKAMQLGHPQAEYVLHNLFDGMHSDMC